MAMQSHFVNRRQEISTFEAILTRKRPERILFLVDEGGKGKSFLLRQLQQIGFGLGWCCVSVEFDLDPMGFLDLCREIRDSLSAEEFQNFYAQERLWLSNEQIIRIARSGEDTESRGSSVSFGGNNQFQGATIHEVAGGDIIMLDNARLEMSGQQWREMRLHDQMLYELSKAFMLDLQSLTRKSKVVIFLDAFENCAPQLSAWVDKWLLRRIGRAQIDNLVAVVAGRPSCYDLVHMNSDWGSSCAKIDGFSELTLEDVRTYYQDKRGLALTEENINFCYQVVRSDPFLMSQIGDRLVSELFI